MTEPAMSESETRSTLAVTVALLERGADLNRLSALLTAAALLLPLFVPQPVAFILLAAALAGVGELYFATRVGLDAALFVRLEATPDLAALDRGLAALGLLPPGKGGRPLAPRIAGARRLLIRQAIAFLLQVLLILFAVAVAMVGRGGASGA